MNNIAKLIPAHIEMDQSLILNRMIGKLQGVLQGLDDITPETIEAMRRDIYSVIDEAKELRRKP